MMDQIPEILNTPCCLWHRAYVSHPDRMIIIRVGNTAISFHRWHYTLRAFPPDWHLYISEDDLTEQEIKEMKAKRGPTIELLKILGQITKG